MVVNDVYILSLNNREFARRVMKARKEALKAIIEDADRHVSDDLIQQISKGQWPTSLSLVE
jgi:hypothetical protein